MQGEKGCSQSSLIHTLPTLFSLKEKTKEQQQKHLRQHISARAEHVWREPYPSRRNLGRGRRRVPGHQGQRSHSNLSFLRRRTSCKREIHRNYKISNFHQGSQQYKRGTAPSETAEAASGRYCRKYFGELHTVSKR